MRAALAIILGLIACACGGGGDDSPAPADYALRADVIASVPGAVAGEAGDDLARTGKAYAAAADALRDLRAPDELADAGDELAASLEAAAQAHAAAATGEPDAVVAAAEAVERVTAARQALLVRTGENLGG